MSGDSMSTTHSATSNLETMGQATPHSPPVDSLHPLSSASTLGCLSNSPPKIQPPTAGCEVHLSEQNQCGLARESAEVRPCDSLHPGYESNHADASCEGNVHSESERRESERNDDDSIKHSAVQPVANIQGDKHARPSLSYAKRLDNKRIMSGDYSTRTTDGAASDLETMGQATSLSQPVDPLQPSSASTFGCLSNSPSEIQPPTADCEVQLSEQNQCMLTRASAEVTPCDSTPVHPGYESSYADASCEGNVHSESERRESERNYDGSIKHSTVQPVAGNQGDKDARPSLSYEENLHHKQTMSADYSMSTTHCAASNLETMGQAPSHLPPVDSLQPSCASTFGCMSNSPPKIQPPTARCEVQLSEQNQCGLTRASAEGAPYDSTSVHTAHQSNHADDSWEGNLHSKSEQCQSTSIDSDLSKLLPVQPVPAFEGDEDARPTLFNEAGKSETSDSGSSKHQLAPPVPVRRVDQEAQVAFSPDHTVALTSHSIMRLETSVESDSGTEKETTSFFQELADNVQASMANSSCPQGSVNVLTDRMRIESATKVYHVPGHSSTEDVAKESFLEGSINKTTTFLSQTSCVGNHPSETICDRGSEDDEFEIVTKDEQIEHLETEKTEVNLEAEKLRAVNDTVQAPSDSFEAKYKQMKQLNKNLQEDKDKAIADVLKKEEAIEELKTQLAAQISETDRAKAETDRLKQVLTTSVSNIKKKEAGFTAKEENMSKRIAHLERCLNEKLKLIARLETRHRQDLLRVDQSIKSSSQMNSQELAQCQTNIDVMTSMLNNERMKQQRLNDVCKSQACDLEFTKKAIGPDAKLVKDVPLNHPIEVDSAVLFAGCSGVVKWIGRDETCNQPDVFLTAVELDYPQELAGSCTSGEYRGALPVRSAHKNILYCQLADCTVDPRFVVDHDTKIVEQMIPCANRTVAEPQPVKPDEVHLGLWKGIQGDQNSCYMDVTLFSMFAYSSVFDEYIMRQCTTEDTEYSDNILNILNKKIVNPLRRFGVVAAESVQEFRTQLDRLGLMKGVRSLEKDPEEFIKLMLESVFRCEPLMHFSNDLYGNTFDLVSMKKDGLEFPSVQMLLELTLLEQAICFKKVPSFLILHVPRFGKGYKLYERIFPNEEIDITNFVQGYQRKCCSCEKKAEFQCPTCFESGFSFSNSLFCGKCKKVSHTAKSDHTPSRTENGKNQKRLTLKLVSALCIETSHYVCFTRTGSQRQKWVFFDSMSQREGENNVPEVKHVEYLPSALADYEIISSKQTSERVPLMDRLFRDVYTCFYRLAHS